MSNFLLIFIVLNSGLYLGGKFRDLHTLPSTYFLEIGMNPSHRLRFSFSYGFEGAELEGYIPFLESAESNIEKENLSLGVSAVHSTRLTDFKWFKLGLFLREGLSWTTSKTEGVLTFSGSGDSDTLDYLETFSANALWGMKSSFRVFKQRVDLYFETFLFGFHYIRGNSRGCEDRHSYSHLRGYGFDGPVLFSREINLFAVIKVF